jgi:hypothetical protein
MNKRLWFGAWVGVGACLAFSCCTSSNHQSETADPAFAKVQAVLETNCVHCHGDNRLSSMPSIHDSHALAKLIGTGKWITPGKPELSRFYQVVIFPDEIPGAMPPTGHAIRPSDAKILREWIATGAKVPAGRVIKFTPRGTPPRSV